MDGMCWYESEWKIAPLPEKEALLMLDFKVHLDATTQVSLQ